MAFWILTAMMTVAALLFVLIPLVRDAAGRQQRRAQATLRAARDAGLLDEDEFQRKRSALFAQAAPSQPPARGAAAGLALLLPCIAAALYFQLGEPRALSAEAHSAGAPSMDAASAGVDGADAPDMERAVQSLAERLRGEPDNLEGWLLLGRAYKSMERFEQAQQALAQAYRLAPEDPSVMIEYAEAQALSTPRRRIDGDNLALIQQAVDKQPDHQRGIWLLGVAAMQGGRPKDAVDRWETLRQLISSDLSAVQALDEQIEAARQAAGLPPARESTAIVEAAGDLADDAAPAAPAAGPRLTVNVDIAPALRERLSDSAVLFVFARAAEGSRVPLAIQRLSAATLPVTVTLDDSQGMMPALTLSSMPEVVVGARVSASGQAVPQSGDLEGLSAPLPSATRTPIRLIIDQVVE